MQYIYKTAKVNPDKLKFKLNVEFEGEEGIDVGALKRTFFLVGYE